LCDGKKKSKLQPAPSRFYAASTQLLRSFYADPALSAFKLFSLALIFCQEETSKKAENLAIF
jgi:hypothetical protein